MESLCRQQTEALHLAKSNPELQASHFTTEAFEELEIYHDNSLKTEDKIEKVKQLDEAIWTCDPRVKNVRGTGFSESTTEISLYDKDATCINYKKTSYSLYSEILAQEGESLASGRYGQTKYSFDELNDVSTITKKVKDNTLGLLNAKSPKTGDYPVVFNRKAFSSILGLLVPMLQADQVHKGFSLFGDSLGEKIATGILQLEDQPLSLVAMGARPFDGEGMPSKKTLLIKDGVLDSFLSNKEYAQKMGIQNTHNASRAGNAKIGISSSNIIMRPGTLATTAIKAMKPKLIEVQNIMGLHAGFNEVSGDFSFQAEGYLYENGERTTGLQNFVVAGNLKDLFLKIEDLGASLLDTGSRIVCPDVLVSSLKVIGD
jgi:PmbA protein